ncbi:MAG: sugar phosphate isomerase/epimerase [Ruminococcaceae bacterium]|nr:sugar phosphate isomerase/epimerase [Oscillospiraceae bacterium]
MKLYGRTQMLPQFSYEEAVKFIMDAGFDGVEISIFEKSFRTRPEFFLPGFAERMKAAMEKYGVRGFSVSAHKDYTESPEALVIVLETLKIAKELGAEYVIINGAIRREAEKYEDQWNAMIRDTKILAAAAEELGLRLAVEYEPGFVIDSTELLLKAFAEIDSPVMGINCDIGHVFLCDPDPMKAIEQSAPYILQCHVENMATGIHNHLVPWEGDMDLSAYLNKLREVGFDGGLGLDLYQYEYADVCADCAAYFRKLMD